MQAAGLEPGESSPQPSGWQAECARVATARRVAEERGDVETWDKLDRILTRLLDDRELTPRPMPTRPSHL